MYGLFFGSTVTLNQVIYADYFGRRSLGVIRGSFQPVQMAFNAAGPWLAGAWYDRAGSYDAAFAVFAALFLAAAVFVALSSPPLPPGQPAGGRSADASGAPLAAGCQRHRPTMWCSGFAKP